MLHTCKLWRFYGNNSHTVVFQRVFVIFTGSRIDKNLTYLVSQRSVLSLIHNTQGGVTLCANVTSAPPCLALEADSTVFIDHFNIRWIRKVLPILMRTASVPKNRNFCPKNAVFYSITPNHAHCGHSDAHLGSLGFPRFLSASEKIEIFKGSNFYLQHADFRAVLSAVLDIATSLSERRLGPEFLIRPRRRLVFLEFPTITPISKEFGMSMKLISIRKSLRQLRRNMK